MRNVENLSRFEIRPQELSINERYIDYLELYNEKLSSTKIVLVKDLASERVRNLKNFN